MMKNDDGMQLFVIVSLIRGTFRAVVVIALLALLFMSMGASYRTPNFVVETQSPQLAEEFGKTAEKLRHELAVLWLGVALPRDWSRPCPVTVQVGPGLGAGGTTTFVFNNGEVFGWRSTIQGSREQILDSVLPHEITHMIFASHFRQKVPRWADEGAATSVEHKTERDKHRKMLVQYLTSRRGIAFNRMFAMVNYPRDIMPLYAQGYALCDFLIQQGGRRKFVNYLRDGLQGDQWALATKTHYGHQSLGELQGDWVAWVGRGFPSVHTAGYQCADGDCGPGQRSWVTVSGCTNAPNCGNPNCGGQQSAPAFSQPNYSNGNNQSLPTRFDWGPAAPDVSPIRTLPPIAPDVPRQPLVPVERDTECLDRLEQLTIQVEQNATVIGELLLVAETANASGELAGELIADIQRQIKEHSHEKVEPTPDELNALVAAVIAKLPPMYFQPETADGKADGKPLSKKLGDTVYLFPILRK